MRWMRRQRESRAIRVTNHSKVINSAVNSAAPTAPQTSMGVLCNCRLVTAEGDSKCPRFLSSKHLPRLELGQ